MGALAAEADRGEGNRATAAGTGVADGASEKKRLSLALGRGQVGVHPMCDFSLHAVKSRPAEVGDKLTTHQFPFGTRGFSAPEDINVAVCLRPGTELSFTDEVRRVQPWPWR